MMEITFLGAALAGLISFLSPCILPIVPFYLSYLAGVGMNQISADAQIGCIFWGSSASASSTARCARMRATPRTSACWVPM